MQLYADLCIRAWEKAAVLAKREDVGVFGCKLRSVKPITEFDWTGRCRVRRIR